MSKQDTLQEIFHNSLRKLKPSGIDGFEGLIADLLEKLTERRFFLASSGFQGGRDMSTGNTGAHIIAVECKRYLNKSSLDDRELLGELVQVSQSIPDLDLWVLVASRIVTDQTQDNLIRFAHEHGFSILIIDTHANPISYLDALCANDQEIVLKFLLNDSTSDKASLKAYFEIVRNHKEFPSSLKKLKDSFSHVIIGYDHWRNHQNQCLLESFSSEEKSRSAFNMPLNVNDNNTNLVEREAVYKELDSWLNNWTRKHEIFILIGEEGDGKTWAAASWLSKKLCSSSELPGALFVASHQVASIEPLELLAQVIGRQCYQNQDSDRLQKQLNRWLERPVSVGPLALIVLDGINERADFNWRYLFDQLIVSPWKERIAVLITCRTYTFESAFSFLKTLPIHGFLIPPYNDNELHVATSPYNIKLSQFSSGLISLLRKPRYMDLAIRYREKIEESGDFTIERLIYEDWRDRISRRSTSSGLISHDEFLGLIRDLAIKSHNESKRSFSRKEIQDQICEDERKTLEELLTGGILVEDPVRTARVIVEKRRMIFGFALFLAEAVHEAIMNDESPEEAISKLIEPKQDIDLKVSICGASIFHALNKDNFPDKGKIVLFQALFDGRNINEETLSGIVSYVPNAPETYIALAEYYWSAKRNNSMAEELLMRGFLRWRDNSRVCGQLNTAIERWMSFVNMEGFASKQGMHGEKKESIRKSITEKIGFHLIEGPFTFAGYELHAIDDEGLLRLARVALAIISHSKRKPFIKAFILWGISREIMDHMNELDTVQWTLRTAEDLTWDDFRDAIDDLLNKNEEITQKAAYHLLTCLGTKEAFQYREKLPKIEYLAQGFNKMIKDHICNQALQSWSHEEYKKCISNKKLPPQFVASRMREVSLTPDLEVPDGFGKRFESLLSQFQADKLWTTHGTTSEDHDLEGIETTLSAFAPVTLCKIVQHIMRTAEKRDGMFLKQLAMRVKTHLLILGHEERDILANRWRRLLENKSLWNEPEETSECFLFFAVLYTMSGDEQLELLLSRPVDVIDLLHYKHLFIPLSTKQLREIYNKIRNGNYTEKELERILWFLSETERPLSPNFAGMAIKHMDSSDTILRSVVLEIANTSKNREAAKQIVESNWTWSMSHNPSENHFGSLVLAEFGKQISFQKLFPRLSPFCLGHAVEQRGLQDDEVKWYGDFLNNMLNTVRTKQFLNNPENVPKSEVHYNRQEHVYYNRGLSLAEEDGSIFSFKSYDTIWGGTGYGSIQSIPKSSEDYWKQRKERESKQSESLKRIILEQMNSGNYWFAAPFQEKALSQVLEIMPDLLERWLSFAYSDYTTQNKLIMLCRSFYEALTRVLFNSNPQEAFKLYHRLIESSGRIRYVDSFTNIQTMQYDLFAAKQCPETTALWNEHLDNCITDKELFETTLVCQLVGNERWLRDKILEESASSVSYKNVRAVILKGFLDDDSIGEELKDYNRQTESWIKYSALCAYEWWRKNSWAKHWFLNYLETDDKVKAWACYKLFLKSVDRRFRIWRDEYIEKSKQQSNRVELLNINSDDIKNNIKKNEKERRERLFAHKILNNQVWPWMKDYIS